MQSLLRLSLLALLLVALGECAIHKRTRDGDIGQQQPTIVEVNLQKENLTAILASARKEQSVFENRLIFLMEFANVFCTRRIFLFTFIKQNERKWKK